MAQFSVGLCLLVLALLSVTSRTSAQDLETENFVDEDEEEEIDLSSYGEAIFGQPDPRAGELVAALSHESPQNPEEVGTYLEGDILFPLKHELPSRNGILARARRWPKAVVPYEIKGEFNSRELAVIHHAFNEYHTRTCIRFRPHTNERDYISIVNGPTGCWAPVGRIGGRQEVNLQAPNCLRTYGTAIHELMHSVGFFHEQNRHERDSYIRVLTENVRPEMMINFKKGSAKTSFGFGVEYDYGSVMHYSPHSFSVNGKPTIVAVRQTKDAHLMGQRTGFSEGDIRKINAMYRCK